MTTTTMENSTKWKAHRFSGRNNIQKVWERYDFIPVKKSTDKKRILAQCKWCHKTNANTCKGRMIKHRMFCEVYQKDFYKDLDDPHKFMPKQVLFKIQNPDLFSDDSSPSPSPMLLSCQQQKQKQQEQQQQIPELPDTSLLSVNNDNSFDQEIIDEIDDEDDTEAINLEGDALFEANLLKDRLKAETEYLHMKTNYYDKLNDLATLKRSLLLFETKKAQLEIHKLSNKN